MAVNRLLDTVRIFHPSADKNGESWIGSQFLLLVEAIDKPLTAYQLRISSNLLGSDSECEGL
jgi:hypothetical protein